MIEIIVLDDDCFAIVKDNGFCQVVYNTDHWDLCLPAKYDTIATFLHTLINGNKGISFLTGSWPTLIMQWLKRTSKMHSSICVLLDMFEVSVVFI